MREWLREIERGRIGEVYTMLGQNEQSRKMKELTDQQKKDKVRNMNTRKTVNNKGKERKGIMYIVP